MATAWNALHSPSPSLEACRSYIHFCFRDSNSVSVQNDPKFKKYTTAIEKCLTSFDNVHEWADFISFLTRLLKTMQLYMQFKEIPRKVIVAKRLAQCLNPALPTGVHQRALDVYSHVLALLGPAGLKRDLAIWSLGLFPFFEYAATSVKPTLLNLFTMHYIPLQGALRPAMKGLIVALLPGLEEETGEFFDKVLNLLGQLAETVSESFFLENIWLILLTVPTVRGPALNFLSRRLSMLQRMRLLRPVKGTDVGLMIRAFAAALEDEHLLVKRGVLDLLDQSFRIDGAAFKGAPSEDQTILMKATIGVVLRRDLTLNRRVYHWLVGSKDETSENQVAYLKTHSLDLLASTLRKDIYGSPMNSNTVRSYKIFISFLDKWEIGNLLTEKLILDAFRAPFAAGKVDGRPDPELAAAANDVYERAELLIVWKELLASMLSSIHSGSVVQQDLDVLRLVVMDFRSHDEEARRVHLPLYLSAVIQIAFVDMSARSLVEWENGDSGLSPIPLTRAKQLYGLRIEGEDEDDGGNLLMPITPISSSFQLLLKLSRECASDLSGATSDKKELFSSLGSMLSLLDALVLRSAKITQTPPIIPWDPSSWLEAILPCITQDLPFELLDILLQLLITLSDTPFLEPPVSIDQRSVMGTLLSQLFLYLKPYQAPYHVRSVHWIWTLEDRTRHAHVESLIASRLSDANMKCDPSAFDEFGVLWRHTDDTFLPGIRLKIPMLIVLDCLRSGDPSLRRTGETWMRTSLKSYLRILDPILHDLLSPNILRVPHTASFNGRQIRCFLYPRAFDQNYVQYLLETLLAVTKFGGQGFIRTAHTTPLRRTHHPTLVSTAEKGNVLHAESTYIDSLVELLLHRFMQTDPAPPLVVGMQPHNIRIKSTCVDLIQSIVSRGEIDSTSLDNIEASLISQLYISVHSRQLDLQNKLLHALHSVIVSSSHPQGGAQRSFVPDAFPPDRGEARRSIHPLLLPTILDAMSVSSNRAILQHWIDFVLMTLAELHAPSQFNLSVSECICRQLRLRLAEVLQFSSGSSPKGKATAFSSTTDSGFITLLNALERLVLASLVKNDKQQLGDESEGEKGGTESAPGLLGFVFGSEPTPEVLNDQITAKSPGYRSLREATRTLHTIWSSTAELNHESSLAINESLSLISGRVRLRCSKVLERFFKHLSNEVFEFLVECWVEQANNQLGMPVDMRTIDVVDALVYDARTVVQMTCEGFMNRVVTQLDRGKKTLPNPDITDLHLLGFLEDYLSHLEGPIAVQVWPRLAQTVREVVATPQVYRAQMFPVLRCMTVACEKIAQTSAMEDRKLRKDIQDLYVKTVDNCVLLAGKSFDQGNWIRRSTKEPGVSSGRVSPSMPVFLRNLEHGVNGHERLLGAASNETKAGMTVVAEPASTSHASPCLPNLRKILADTDKQLGVCSNIVYYIVNNASKARSSKTLDLDDYILDLLSEMVKIPGSSKAWKPVILDSFNDARFFNSRPAVGQKWKPLIMALVDSDKQSLSDLIARTTAAPSTNIFTSRETEMLLRSLNLRRLSFVLYSGEKNHFLVQLPTIQEKLVDVLRMISVSPIVQSEARTIVFLCMRILICRLSPHNMNSFWPTILTELYRTFEQLLTSIAPPDGSEELTFVLSACKLLDLLLVLQTEEFQVHEWIFTTDTIDAILQPDGWSPTALMDRTSQAAHAVLRNHLPSSTGTTQLRRPLLHAIRSISSLSQLGPFFSTLSMLSYESTYARSLIDWDAVEQDFLEEMFEGL
ncbi:Dopey, N-terminal-domain-containing protein [Cantharellus anzutake]|uniref:Dopey, N-terminal-domain-containing protein n=1 Tax=Cantharellus anzutake TaxID=1750568 RepID=UPI001908E5F6|nr:Dopey, N-terminal-domain-containing protein [Cantharellus anzutake]KAF8337070.1 Dopey, N-terminal-domain-containing protein [Cantharellus anzutake]